MTLRVFNTRTRAKEPFTPLHPNVVRIYSCGLTVYAPMHIGHARTYCFWDTFRRHLEYLGHHVMSVINYTDIDDRIVKGAGDGGCLDLVERMIARFRLDCRTLQIKDYAVYTRATDFIAEQIQMVKQLLELGHAYVVDGEVLYDVMSFERYGQLSGKTLEGNIAGASNRLNDEARKKRHPGDFTLWKPSKPGEPAWPTGEAEWPSGRPGWHIECSAMSTTLLGKHFDVHGGAVDNMFPHHENEIAQSEPLFGHPWVGYWLHPEHLDLRDEEGKSIKMSKSLGNVISVPELLSRHSVDEVRWFFNTSHYRTKLAFNWELVSAEVEGYRKIRRLLSALEEKLMAAPEDRLCLPRSGTYASLRMGEVPRDREGIGSGEFGELSERFMKRFVDGLNDDMGSPAATAALHDYVRELNSAGVVASEDVSSQLAVYRCLARHLFVLGIEAPNARLYPELAADSFSVAAEESGESDAVGAVLDRMLAARQAARASKDFQKSDLIRDLLKEAGVEIEDSPKGSRWSLKE